MTLDWRRFAASAAYAVIFTLVVSGSTFFTTDTPGRIALVGTMAVIAVVLYRLAPDLLQRWLPWASSPARAALMPTPQRVAGTVILATPLTIAYLNLRHLVLPVATIDAVALAQHLIIFGAGIYFSWPSIEQKRHHWRSG